MSIINRFSLPCALSILAAVCSLGCSGASTSVVSSPLTTEKLNDLHCTMEGTWTLRTIDGKDMGAMTDQRWVFRGKGSGEYQQRRGTNALMSAAVYEGDNPFTWRLDGANLILNLEKGSRTTVYRVDEWSQQEMTWFNYTLSDSYRLERTGDGDYEGCMMIARPSAGDGPVEP